MEITKMLGAGLDWYYLVDDLFKIQDAARDNDKDGMQRLHQKKLAEQGDEPDTKGAPHS